MKDDRRKQPGETLHYRTKLLLSLQKNTFFHESDGN